MSAKNLAEQIIEGKIVGRSRPVRIPDSGPIVGNVDPNPRLNRFRMEIAAFLFLSAGISPGIDSVEEAGIEEVEVGKGSLVPGPAAFPDFNLFFSGRKTSLER